MHALKCEYLRRGLPYYLTLALAGKVLTITLSAATSINFVSSCQHEQQVLVTRPWTTTLKSVLFQTNSNSKAIRSFRHSRTAFSPQASTQSKKHKRLFLDFHSKSTGIIHGEPQSVLKQSLAKDALFSTLSTIFVSLLPHGKLAP